jgi:hypothetical protein
VLLSAAERGRTQKKAHLLLVSLLLVSLLLVSLLL